jgi:hypothetical protein
MVRGSLSSVCALCWAVTALGQAVGEGWRPEIPRVWDDEAIATIEVPSPHPGASPVHVSSEYYYRIPVREIYRSYPIYHPDHEPEGYWEWLHQQHPEIVFDPAALESEEEWIRAGELVFQEGVEYSTGVELQSARDRDSWAAARIPVTKDGLFAWGRWFVREKGKVEIGTNACATCHIRVLPDGSVVLGAQGNFPLGWIVRHEIRRSVTQGGAAPPIIDERSSNYRSQATPYLDPDPNAALLGRTLLDVADLMGALPPGVIARQRASLFIPVRVPDLIGIRDLDYLDASGLVQHRGVGDLMRYAALNQGADELSSFAGFVPAADANGKLPDPATLTRYSDEQLYALAVYLYSLEPPPNPNPVDAAAERGRLVFEREQCGRCHPPPLYTNNRLLPADGFDVPAGHRDRFQVLDLRVGTDPGLTMKTRRGTGFYKVPSLRGLWYRGPLGHAGWVASLEDWFDRARLRDDYVPTAYRGLGVETRAVPGHPYGLELDAGEKSDLIRFLRSL